MVNQQRPWIAYSIELQNLSIAIHQSQPPAPAEPFREVLCQHMDTLCSMQKQIQPDKLLNAGYTCFNKHDSSKLEDWLIDIETAADHTSESRGRFANVKSQGLTCTLVTEVISLISSNKSWDEIKDLLRLKLCNVDIHMYTL